MGAIMHCFCCFNVIKYTKIYFALFWRNKMYNLLLALIYLAFISLGLPDSLLGSGWPETS